MDGSTPTYLHTPFISAQICRRLRGVPFLVRKISPEVIFLPRAYFSSFRHSLLGRRMVRILPFRAISVRPALAASTVIYRTSDTRMPVAQMVSISRARRSLP